MSNPQSDKSYSKTLSQVHQELKNQGFTEEFMVQEDGRIMTSHSEEVSPEDLHIIHTYRFEGNSNPADMAVIYAIESRNGLKGTLIDAYGTYASSALTEVLNKIK